MREIVYVVRVCVSICVVCVCVHAHAHVYLEIRKGLKVMVSYGYPSTTPTE